MHQSAAVAAGPFSPSGESRLRRAPDRCLDEANSPLDALAAMYDLHAAVVLSLCRGRLGWAGLDEAEDACQDTFMRAYRKVIEGDHPTTGAAARRWLYAIARNVCRERLRARRRREHHELAAHRHNGTAATIDAHASAAPSVEAIDMSARLTDAISALPERERLALHLHYLEDDPVLAAREAMNVSRSGYYKILNRARAMIARHLAPSHTSQP